MIGPTVCSMWLRMAQMIEIRLFREVQSPHIPHNGMHSDGIVCKMHYRNANMGMKENETSTRSEVDTQTTILLMSRKPTELCGF
jgi:hypothetical protein